MSRTKTKSHQPDRNGPTPTFQEVMTLTDAAAYLRG